jgi:hypothetical protein
MKAVDFVQSEEGMGEAAMRFLETQKEMAEEKSDELIDWMLEKVNLPFWIPKKIIRRVLDHFLPGKLFDLIEKMLQMAGQLPTDRQSHPANPFRN